MPRSLDCSTGRVSVPGWSRRAPWSVRRDQDLGVHGKGCRNHDPCLRPPERLEGIFVVAPRRLRYANRIEQLQARWRAARRRLKYAAR